VSETINYDLLKLIQEKTEKCETLSIATNFGVRRVTKGVIIIRKLKDRHHNGQRETQGVNQYY
jgi:hypothetical protein